jgi:hypothetical protein
MSKHLGIAVGIAGMGIAALASLAHAGLAEREKQRELEPKIASAAAAVTATCGCSPGIQVDWSTFKTVASMYTLDFLMSNYQEIAESTCKADKEARDGFCGNVKNVTVKWAPDSPSASCANGTCGFAVSSESYLTDPFKQFLEQL